MPDRRWVATTIATVKFTPSYFLRFSILRPSGTLSVVVVLLTLSSVARSGAQEKPKPPEKSDTTLARQVGSAAAKPVQIFNLLDRKSVVFPDIASDTNPFPVGRKFQLFVDNSISVHTILWSGLGSAVEQADNSPTGFGQGWEAYGKRFGSSMARGASGQLFGTFVLASALHEDPRFFPEVNPGFAHAVTYSLTRLFVTRSDDGHAVANGSGLLGPLLGEGLANAYWPDRNRTIGDTFLRYGIDLATRAGGNMLREYWPVVYRKLDRSGSSAGPRP